MFSDFGQGSGVFIAIDRDPDHVGAGAVQVVDQGDGRRDIGRMGGGHALDGDRVTGSDGDRADADVSGWISVDLHRVSWDLRDLLVVYRTGSKPPTAVEKAGKTGLGAGLFGLASPKLVTMNFRVFQDWLTESTTSHR